MKKRKLKRKIKKLNRRVATLEIDVDRLMDDVDPLRFSTWKPPSFPFEGSKLTTQDLGILQPKLTRDQAIKPIDEASLSPIRATQGRASDLLAQAAKSAIDLSELEFPEIKFSKDNEKAKDYLSRTFVGIAQANEIDLGD